jgi:hypothetical protein
MARVFGVLLIVLGVWAGMEIYTKGMRGAFGGALARFEEPLHAAPGSAYDESGKRGSLAERMGAKVQSDIQAGVRRDAPDADGGEDGH